MKTVVLDLFGTTIFLNPKRIISMEYKQGSFFIIHMNISGHSYQWLNGDADKAYDSFIKQARQND